MNKGKITKTIEEDIEIMPKMREKIMEITTTKEEDSTTMVVAMADLMIAEEIITIEIEIMIEIYMSLFY